jgi:hypothetical protein
MTWTRVTAFTMLVGLVAAVAFVWPAQANTPACDRQQDLAAILQGGHYVPEPVLQMAEAHCWGGSVAEEKVRLDSPGLDIIKSCQRASRQPRDVHEARCIASWLTYWDKPDAEPDACVHHLVGSKLYKTDAGTLAKLDSKCKRARWLEQHGPALGVGTALALVVIFVIFAGRNSSTRFPSFPYTPQK